MNKIFQFEYIHQTSYTDTDWGMSFGWRDGLHFYTDYFADTNEIVLNCWKDKTQLFTNWSNDYNQIEEWIKKLIDEN